MTTYAIGDIQGCFDELLRLLDKLGFNPRGDRLWFTGDLVNRGPKSLETLRFVKNLGDAAVTVLGNHDLHLLAIDAGTACARRQDTLDAILAAPDRDELLHWLRHRPLFHVERPYCLVHAGLPPQWDIEQALCCAAEMESVLRGDHYGEYFRHMYGNSPDRWREDLSGWSRLRFITNCFTRMRYCDREGRLDMKHKGPPGTQPEHLLPWFQVPGRKSRTSCVVFGHWSTLQFHKEDNCYGLDTGCLWGGELTALILDHAPRTVSVDCPCARKPGN